MIESLEADTEMNIDKVYTEDPLEQRSLNRIQRYFRDTPVQLKVHTLSVVDFINFFFLTNMELRRSLRVDRQEACRSRNTAGHLKNHIWPQFEKFKEQDKRWLPRRQRASGIAKREHDN